MSRSRAGSDLTLGATVVDWWKVTDRTENAFVVRDVDADRFFDLFIERVGRL
jgi:purine nucleosidase